ncbi:MAG: beta-methylgalactoside transporter [Oscillospiraceae bacterium]|nr:beta-methylgalactoside transporter [Oscillospiraceae bacterium]
MSSKEKTVVKSNPLNGFLKYLKENPIVDMVMVVVIIMCFTVDNFFSMSNFNNLAGNTAVRFLVALGVSGCLITKGTDLSAGRQVGLAACVTGILVQRANATGKVLPNLPEMNMFVVLAIVLVIGALIGIVNGLVIAKLNVPPFIATLGTQTIIYGTAMIMTDAQPIGYFQQAYKDFVSGAFFRSKEPGGFDGITYLMIIAILAGIFFWFLYNKTTHGKYMYAIGGNENAAEVSGVNTTRSKILIYMTAGIMYALAGYLLAGKAGGANSGLGTGYELEAIAGCTIGGVSTTGGIGTVGGILVGVLVFELLKIVLQFLGVNPYYNYIAQGLVIVVAVALDIRKYVKKK